MSDFMLPIFVSAGFVAVLGAAAIYVTPTLLERRLLPRLPKSIREQASDATRRAARTKT